MVRLVMPQPRTNSHSHTRTATLPTLHVNQNPHQTMAFPNQQIDDLIDMLSMARFDWSKYRRDVFVACLALSALIPDNNLILHDCLIRCAKYCQTASGKPEWLNAFIEILASARRNNGTISTEHLIPAEWQSLASKRSNQSVGD